MLSETPSSCRTDTLRGMEPRRLLLFESGAALGVFPVQQGSTGGEGDTVSVVVMEPSGACFTHVRQDGTCHRQLSDFCRRDLVPQVAAVANFRNAHSPRPYLSRRLHANATLERSPAARQASASRLARWPAARDSGGSSRHCTLHADGRVEVRAVTGNARLTLSASGTTCEVDFASSIPSVPSPLEQGEEKRESGSDRGGREAKERATLASRIWVTRRFVASFSSVPPEFSHALGVALAVSLRGGAEEEEDGAALGVTGGLVASELPRPEDGNMARWDTVQSLPRFDDSANAGVWPTGRSSTSPAVPGLLAVDVLKLADGTGFAGNLAAIVESTAGCTYRVVLGGDGEGEGGGVTVHVSVHADGTEVVLSGDFVRVTRPPPASQTGRPKERLLHVSVASTVILRAQRSSLASSASRATARTAGCAHAPESADVDSGAVAADRGESEVISLGEITSRSLGLRRHFTACGRLASGGSVGRIKQRGGDCTKPLVPAARELLTEAGWPCGGTSAARAAAKENAVPAALGTPRRRHGLPFTVTSRSVNVSSTTTPSISPARAPAVSAEVVERVERGGASFVLFADGRARGAFADRTIITLGPPVLLALREDVAIGPTHKRGASQAVEDGRVPPGGDPEGDREIECLLPDGTMVRRTYSSMSRGYTIVPASGEASPLTGIGNVYQHHPALGGSLGSDPVFVGLRPYILAVRRFVAWASLDPPARREAAVREEARQLQASAEAERNRRFVALQRLVAKTPGAPRCGVRTREDGRRQVVDRFSMGRMALPSDGRGGVDMQPSGSAQADDKKNVGIPGRVAVDGVGRLPQTAGERNAFVKRLLDANRDVLLGQEASEMVARRVYLR